MTNSSTPDRRRCRPKTVLTDVGPVEFEVPRDRDGSFEPKIVEKRSGSSGSARHPTNLGIGATKTTTESGCDASTPVAEDQIEQA